MPTNGHTRQPGQAVVICGDARNLPLPDASVDLIVTSPPYYALRSYTDGGTHYPGQIGSEPTPQAYIDTLIECTAEWARVLKPGGSMFIDLGDKYSTGNSGNRNTDFNERSGNSSGKRSQERSQKRSPRVAGMPPKSLLLLPERYRIAAVDHLGLICRAVIIWAKPNCISGGTIVYARVNGRPTTIKVHDLCRHYQPKDVQLWNGHRWTQVLWWQPTGRHPDANQSYKAIRAARRRADAPVIGGDIEIELRSGERVGCTREHRWPTRRGLVTAAELVVGDVLDTGPLPDGETTPSALDDEMVGWFVGLYIAEGSRSGQTIQIAGHVRELARLKRLNELAEAFHGTCKVHATGGNAATINLTGTSLRALLDMYVGGHTAKDKHLAPKTWQRSNRFLRAVLDGYLSGDGHSAANRWIVKFTNNDALAADLRTLCARLALSIRLKRATHTGFGKQWPGWSGNITAPHRRRAPDSEITAIRQSRARQFWDIGVEDEPHLFALASGILTHNSLPESVTDRVRRSHEDWVHLVKAPRYYSAVDEIREPHTGNAHPSGKNATVTSWDSGKGVRHRTGRTDLDQFNPLGKLPGSVWSIPSEPLTVPDELGVDHFAAFPTEWPRRLILGWSPPGICTVCGEGRRPVRQDDWDAIPHTHVHKRALTPAETVTWCQAFADWCDQAGVTRRDLDHAAGTTNMGGWWASRLPHRSIVPTPEQWARLRQHINPPATFDELVHLTRAVPTAGGFGGDLDPGSRLQRTHRTGTGMTSRAGPPKTITGYRCACPEPTAPTRSSVILDPFGGTGTTALAARALGRIGVSVDRSHDYSRLAVWRTTNPGELAKAMRIPKPEPVPPNQLDLF